MAVPASLCPAVPMSCCPHTCTHSSCGLQGAAWPWGHSPQCAPPHVPAQRTPAAQLYTVVPPACTDVCTLHVDQNANACVHTLVCARSLCLHASLHKLLDAFRRAHTRRPADKHSCACRHPQKHRCAVACTHRCTHAAARRDTPTHTCVHTCKHRRTSVCAHPHFHFWTWVPVGVSVRVHTRVHAHASAHPRSAPPGGGRDYF